MFDSGKFETQQALIQHVATTKKVQIDPITLSDWLGKLRRSMMTSPPGNRMRDRKALIPDLGKWSTNMLFPTTPRVALSLMPPSRMQQKTHTRRCSKRDASPTTFLSKQATDGWRASKEDSTSHQCLDAVSQEVLTKRAWH